jgi:Icc protein
LQQALDEIDGLHPDVVVVTGDVTEDGTMEEFRMAKEYLEQFRCAHVVVGCGNHDARTTGYLLFPRFFGAPSSVTELGDIVLIMLNSSRPDRDLGEMGYNQGLWMKKHLDRYEARYKIVALHHHLLPVPDTGMEQNIVSDAGDLLWTLTSHHVDLVLCGHRHRPWMWRIGTLPIVHAGAISTNRLRGFYRNTYNIIRINEGKLRATLKIVGGDELDLTPSAIQERAKAT